MAADKVTGIILIAALGVAGYFIMKKFSQNNPLAGITAGYGANTEIPIGFVSTGSPAVDKKLIAANTKADRLAAGTTGGQIISKLLTGSSSRINVVPTTESAMSYKPVLDQKTALSLAFQEPTTEKKITAGKVIRTFLTVSNPFTYGVYKLSKKLKSLKT